jgi:phosphonate ABC transporter, ATP-binding protein
LQSEQAECGQKTFRADAVPLLKETHLILEVHNISKTYGSDKAALKNISFSLNEGETVAVIGASGAGKSTMLRCINRLIEFDSGKIIFDGKDIKRAGKKELKHIRSKIGMVFQHYNLVERLNALENVLHGCLGSIPVYRGAFGFYTTEEKKNAYSLLQKVGLEDFVYKYCSELSGGQKQRVGIARALMQEPKLLLCDEPVSSLDPKSSETVLDYIKFFSSTKKIACIINLHQIDFAKKYADRIIALRAGEIVYDGKPSELSEEILRSEIFKNRE